ncbi:MAG: AMP-binding protein [Gemmatimonadota bacterium]
MRHHFRTRPLETALWTAPGDTWTFADVAELAAGAQRLIRRHGVDVGDTALVLSRPSPSLFAAILGLLGSGVTAVFVEPWLPLDEVDAVIRRVRPRIFLGSPMARLWALRVPEVRRIPTWVPLSRIGAGSGGTPFECRPVDPDTPGTVTFSSGTTGSPKGLVRSHECLGTLFRLLGETAPEEALQGPDLCVFPNLALLHLATGRGAVLFPSDWSPRSFRRVASVARSAGPTTLSCGPGFLARLLTHVDAYPDRFGSLRQVAVGGAQVDCELLERGFRRWPEARWLQVYGGSEAEPVALTDAMDSVRWSRERGLFQALFLGRPIPELDTELTSEGVRVRGPNVARRYGAGEGRQDEGRRHARGRDWHAMGDRIESDSRGWWYEGRIGQPRAEFLVEQRLYAELGTSASFVARDTSGRLYLYGERLPAEARDFRPGFRSRHPELDGVRPVRIVRDRRHGARIDRNASLVRGGWIHE